MDRYIASAPMRAVCGFDRRRVGDRAIAELACLHPATHGANVHFTLRTGPHGGPAAILSGDLDPAADELLPAALAHVRPEPTGGSIVFDASDLRVFDHRALLHLQRYAEQAQADVVLRTSLVTVGKLIDLIGVTHVRAEPVR